MKTKRFAFLFRNDWESLFFNNKSWSIRVFAFNYYQSKFLENSTWYMVDFYVLNFYLSLGLNRGPKV